MALAGTLNASTVFFLLLLLLSSSSPTTPRRRWRGGGGFTVFCPADDAVAAFIPAFRGLTADAKVALLLYHAVAAHFSEEALKAINGEVNTLATDGGGGGKVLNLTIEEDDDGAGATVKLSSSSGNVARVTKTIQDADPHAVYLIDAVLMPLDVVVNVSSGGGAAAPSPAPVTSPAPAPAQATNPSPSPDSKPDNQPAAEQPPENSASRGGMAAWSLLSVVVPAIASLVLR
ncbi:fasciclin-like arabinogalactan protein 1 [Oryza sativa Japonica Group]|uniref:fasciclin-like arabinogalactan protein 1 n=1 Tax=Oryza sativa subsp. japonica TaxID=39947 RepID=UPI000E1BC5FF|nr:fasciclin-like arabinogalactan protein 1 [Oryza sativa Japonica Group]